MDVATLHDVKRQKSSFGDVFAHYNAHPGPYIVLPFFGPSNARDGVGRVIDMIVNPVDLITIKHNKRLFYTYFVARTINERKNLLDTTNTINQVALDPYAFVRSAYFNNIKNQKIK